MDRKRNTEAIIQILVLLAIACLLIYAMLSKKVNYYVHPRFYIGIWISILILILFAVSLITKVQKARHNVNVRHYLIYVIPLITALLFPASGVKGKDITLMNSDRTASESTKENTNRVTEENAVEDLNTDDYAEDSLTSKEQSSNVSDRAEDSTANSSLQEEDENTTVEEDTVEDTVEDTDEETSNTVEGTVEETSEETVDISEKYTQYEENGVMVINDDIFADWYCDVYDNLDAFIGKKCRYLAQVYSMEDFKENQFLAGRYFMVCCAADLVGYGILCESDLRSDLKDEEWITVEGTIGQYEYNGYIVPMLSDVKITSAKAPEIEYIYYNTY